MGAPLPGRGSVVRMPGMQPCNSWLPLQRFMSSNTTGAIQLLTMLHLPISHLRNLMPEFIPGKTLADSGAFASITTEEMAQNSKARWIFTKQSPVFIMANGSHSRPLGLVKIRTWISPTFSIHVRFWVVKTMPVDVILGTRALKQLNAVINYPAQALHMTVNGTDYTLPFCSSVCDRPFSANVLYAREQVLLNPNEHVTLMVHSSKSQRT